jgi:integrase
VTVWLESIVYVSRRLSSVGRVHRWERILHSKGIDIKSISEVLGHSDIGTTSRIYTHLFDKTHKDTVSVMSRALKN